MFSVAPDGRPLGSPPYELVLLRASVALPFFDTRALPILAVHLLSHGLDSPGLLRLALMSTEPFDPRDAHEAAEQAAAELDSTKMSREEASAVLLSALVGTVLGGDHAERAATDLAWQVLMSVGFSPREGRLGELGYLNDTWDAGWAGPNDKIAARVRAILDEARESGPLGRDVDVDLLRSLMPLRQPPAP